MVNNNKTTTDPSIPKIAPTKLSNMPRPNVESSFLSELPKKVDAIKTPTKTIV